PDRPTRQESVAYVTSVRSGTGATNTPESPARLIERRVTMRRTPACSSVAAWFGGGLCALALTGPVNASEPTKGAGDGAAPAVGLFDGLRRGTVAVSAEGTGDGRMVLSVTNRSARPLRVVLPPGLIASGSTGQFGGGGFGGAGGGGFGGGGFGGG